MAVSAVPMFLRFRRCFQVIKALNNANSLAIYSQSSVLINRQLKYPIYLKSYMYSSEAKPEKQKTEPKPRITLIGTDEKLSVVQLEEAEKIAKRRDLQLIKVSDIDTKTHRAVYKLLALSGGNIKSRPLKSVQSNRGEKQVSLSPRISPHDVGSRIKQINKWLQKGLEVRVVINGSAADSSSSEQVSQMLEKAVEENKGRVTQKRVKDGNIKFSILPPKASD